MSGAVAAGVEPRQVAAMPAGSAPWTAEVGGVVVHAGPGCLERVGEAARELGGRRALLVTDPGVRGAGHAERAAGRLAGAGVAVELFDEVPENPTSADVARGAEAARRFAADLLVAVGGGSAMDAAKGINFVATGGGRMEDYWGYGKAAGAMLPSIAAPTTAGTGSDAQCYALINAGEPEPGMLHGRKMACGDRQARFRVVLLDPELAATAPRRAAALAGLDAIAHAVETAVTARRNPISALYSREAFRRLVPAFERLVAGAAGPAEWSDLLLGAHLAGAAIEVSMLGAAHAAANPLTGACGLAHGLAVSVMLPPVVRFNAEEPEQPPPREGLPSSAGSESSEPDHSPPREGLSATLPSRRRGGRGAEENEAARLYRELCGESAERLAARLVALRLAAGLPRGLADCGVPRERLPELARLATREWTGNYNPRRASERDFLELYDAAW